MHFIVYLLFRALHCLIQLFPLGVIFWLAKLSGRLSYYVLPKRRRIAFENIDRVYKDTLTPQEKTKLVKNAFLNASYSVTELLFIKKIAKTAKAEFEINGHENIAQAFRLNKGVMLVISHLGAWELLEFVPFLMKEKWSVVVKSIKNPYIDRFINKCRRVTTVNPINKNDSIRTVIKELKQGNGVALLVDQWAGPEGIWVDFFGEPTSTTSVPARLAKKTDSVFVAAYCIRKKVGSYRIDFEPLTLVDATGDWEKQTTLKINKKLEEKIRLYPDQWLWGHRRWKPKPSQIREVG